MSLVKLEQLIEQHGEEAVEFEEQVFQIGDAYIIPNFGFEVAVEESLNLFFGNKNCERLGLADIQVFAKSENFTFYPKEMDEIEITDLFLLCKQLYPKDYSYRDFPQWWGESDVRESGEELDQLDFAIWMEDAFLFSPNPEGIGADLLDSFLQSIQPWLGEELIMYRFDDDGDSNCGFCPYVFIGDRCIIVAARKWAL